MGKIINEIIKDYFDEFDRDVLVKLENIVQNWNIDLNQLQDLEIIKNSILENKNLSEKKYNYIAFLIAIKYSLISKITLNLFWKSFSKLSKSEKKILNKYLWFSETVLIDSKISWYCRFLKSEKEINPKLSKNNVTKRISEVIWKNKNYSYSFLEKEVKDFNLLKISVIWIWDFYYENNNFLEKYKKELIKPEEKNKSENSTLNNWNSSENNQNSNKDRWNSEEKPENQQENSENSSDWTNQKSYSNQNNSNATENKSSENQNSTTNTQWKKHKQESINEFLTKVENENLDKEWLIDRICKVILSNEKDWYNSIREQFSIWMWKSLDEINFMIKSFKEKKNKSES